MTAKPDQLLSIGKIAEAAGVSTQTVRVWEKRGLIKASRTDGGTRVFTKDMLKQALDLAASSRRARDQQLPGTASPESLELASTGMRIRAARLAKRLSQQQAADAARISRSFLAAVERGESGTSIDVLARLADAFAIPMSQFAPPQSNPGRVMRVADRPKTVLAGGVAWEELATPGGHDMEPALLHIPAGQGSGGPIVRPGADFVFVMTGQLIFALGEHQEEITLATGDAMVVEAGTPVAWRNEGSSLATCLWIELIASLRAEAGEKWG